MFSCQEMLYLSFITVGINILTAVVFISSIFAMAVNGLSSNANIPYFEPRPNNISYHVGETATLLCSVQGLETRYIVWRRSSEPNPLTIGDFVYSPDERISVRRIKDKNEWNLVIKDVGQDDAGVYECAISSTEKYKRLVLLRINGTTRSESTESGRVKDSTIYKQQVTLSGKKFVTKGSKIFLVCNVSGEDYAPYGVDWFINGHVVNQKNFPRVRILFDVDNNKRTLYSTLEIKQSIMSDNGIYVCRGMGSETDSITIHVLDEEKSSIDKRGFVNDSDSSMPCCYLKWIQQCPLLFVCLSSAWFTYSWFVT